MTDATLENTVLTSSTTPDAADGMAAPQGNAAGATPFQLTDWLGGTLFLDFDGTLVDLAETPEGVHVMAGLVPALQVLQRHLGGRLAIVSGRPIAQIDAMLAPLSLPVAGVHGNERRDATGLLHYSPEPDLSGVQQCAEQLAVLHPRLRVEHKRGALALHYRQAPQLEALCREAMLKAVDDSPGIVLLFGKMVIEAKPAGVNKGTAIADFMAEAPFIGHLPLFAGDDTTDEAGFSTVQQAGGMGLKVGPGPTAARRRIATPQDLRDQLLLAAAQILKGIPT
jgi:trehalose 6-phosphate phosphatase